MIVSPRRTDPSEEDDRCLVAHQGVAVLLADILRAIGRISCLMCGRSGLEHHDLDHILVDPFDPPASLK